MHMGISECVPSFKTFYHTVVLIHNKNSLEKPSCGVFSGSTPAQTFHRAAMV